MTTPAATPPGSSPTPTLLVVGALIAREEDRRVLIAQRPAGFSLAGQWEFPGGKVEPGEDPRAALVRECREELAITVEVGAIYETIFALTPTRPILLLFYRTRIVEGTPYPVEGHRLEWATVEELPAFPLLEPDRPLLHRFRDDFPAFRRGI